MGIGFLGKNGDDDEDLIEDDFVELDAKAESDGQEVVVRAETLQELEDVEPVQDHLRNEHIVWVNIQPLKSRDMTKLKRAVKRLKKTVRAVNGDIAGVDEEWIVVTPEYARIERKGEEMSEA
jgi:SepF-like predicted cell division protein (DUF552 family)